MRGATALAKQSRQSRAPVVIEHLRLAYEMEPKGSPEAQRIKDINRALGRNNPEGATRLTAFRLRSSPLAMLLNEKLIGGEEMTAAQDIEMAFVALSGSIGFKPLTMERVQGGQHPDWSDKTTRAVSRYKEFAAHWSIMKKLGDRTLEVLFMAVIDQRPFSIIEADIGMRHGKAKKVVVRALRDYAARAGWVSGRTASDWKAEASTSFKRIKVS